MGFVTLVTTRVGKRVLDITLEYDSASDAEDEAMKIAKSLPRGRPYKLITKNTETGEQVGKTRNIHGERFNSRTQPQEQLVNYSEGFKTIREGRQPINPTEIGLDNIEDPRWSPKNEEIWQNQKTSE